ncbi:hypothetical protein Misp01_11760 [Microtetraspora sp. NBRC 13810]|nr:hypothetical protein Misp01_11760 [Microtetraspora sp. NBRC 13810]
MAADLTPGTGTDRPPPEKASGGDVPDLAEVNAPDWFAHAEDLSGTGFLTVARRLPFLVGHAVRMAWGASPRDTTLAIALSLFGGVFTAFGLLATTGVLEALFSAGPTPDRVRAAVPDLVLVAVAAILRSSLQAGAGWAQARLGPQVSRASERRLFGLTSQVDLVSFDDPEFHDELQRARLRGMAVADTVVDTTIDLLTGVIGLAAVAGVLGFLHPLLLPLLVLAVLPDAWAAVRAARMGYATDYALIPARRRKWIITELMADRRTAAETRSFTMRDFLLRLYDRVAGAEQDVMLGLARRQTVARVVGEALSGIGTLAVFVALGVLLATGTVPLAVASPSVTPARTARRCAACRCTSTAARWSPWWGRTARARPPSPRSSPLCTSRTRAGSPGTAPTSPPSTRTACAPASP